MLKTIIVTAVSLLSFAAQASAGAYAINCSGSKMAISIQDNKGSLSPSVMEITEAGGQKLSFAGGDIAIALRPDLGIIAYQGSRADDDTEARLFAIPNTLRKTGSSSWIFKAELHYKDPPMFGYPRVGAAIVACTMTTPAN